MTPRSRFAALAALLLAVAACGPGGPTSPSGSTSASPCGSPGSSLAAGACPTTPPPPGTPEGWDTARQTPSVYPQIITTIGALACGKTRFMFSFIDKQNVPVGAPDRTVEVALFDLGTDPAKPVQT